MTKTWIINARKGGLTALWASLLLLNSSCTKETLACLNWDAYRTSNNDLYFELREWCWEFCEGKIKIQDYNGVLYYAADFKIEPNDHLNFIVPLSTLPVGDYTLTTSTDDWCKIEEIDVH